MTPLPDKAWFPVAEAAQLLGVSRRTIYRWIERGEVEYTGMPFFWRVSRQSLMKKVGGSV